LDPAEPNFDSFNDTLRLDPSDAIFVDVIHKDGERFTGYKGQSRTGMGSQGEGMGYFQGSQGEGMGFSFRGRKYREQGSLSGVTREGNGLSFRGHKGKEWGSLSWVIKGSYGVLFQGHKGELLGSLSKS
ncbi:hypothetical protein RRG08_000391, partial [Elysia crispata]